MSVPVDSASTGSSGAVGPDSRAFGFVSTRELSVAARISSASARRSARSSSSSAASAIKCFASDLITFISQSGMSAST